MMAYFNLMCHWLSGAKRDLSLRLLHYKHIPTALLGFNLSIPLHIKPKANDECSQ